MDSRPIVPTPPSQRIELLDSLRGFALAGVLAANLVAFSLYFFMAGDSALALPSARVDHWLDPAVGILVSGKFITLFSMLFGVGFSLHMERTAANSEGTLRYLRRLAVLFAIGMVHGYLFWWGDILRYYAVLGLLLVPISRLLPTTMTAAFGLAGLGALLVIVPHPSLVSGLASQEQAYATVFAAFSSSDLGTMLHGNRDFNAWWIVVHWGLVLSVSGCMLIGVALGRAGVLRDPTAHAVFWKRSLWIVLPLGLAASVLVELASYGRLPLANDWLRGETGSVTLRMLRPAATLALALGYMAAFVRLFAQPAARRWLHVLAPVGRMALSNYLTHTLLGIGIFYGIGAGLGPRYGLVGVAVSWALIFIAQIAASRWWLARFRFGPAEWVWRSLTYGRRQPMRLRAVTD